MKFVTFSGPSGVQKLGVVVNGDTQVLDLAAAAEILGTDASVFGSMLDLIHAGQDGLDRARQVVAQLSGGKIEAALAGYGSVRLLSPLPRPEQIRDFLCFERHLRQARRQRLKLVAAKQADPDAALQAMIDAGQADPAPIWYEQPIY